MAEDLLHKLALHFMPGIGPVLARALLNYCGTVDNIFKTKKSLLERIPGIGKERAALVNRKNVFDKAEKEIQFLEKHNVRPLFYLDDGYPSRLKNCYDAPLMLFYKGNTDLNSERMIAMVGTRMLTSYGRDMIDKIIEDLAKLKIVVVSGLAFGADVHAHKAALKNGLSTIAVVAHGLDKLYPMEHRSTAERMIDNGGLLSEYGSGVVADKENFPARNRIVAGMCDATIVVESAEKGGALITADLANDYNRDVFAVPGRITDAYSRGCHQLIRRNKAMIFESVDHFLEIMNWDEKKGPSNHSRIQLDLFATLTETEKKIVDILKESGQTAIDSLAHRAEMPVSKVSSTLLSLEFSGVLRSLPGKIYELI